ncbi:DUF3291 domain-containing protein [Fibrella forsythiae]|uniref:DUF3291 domain-containing protein n=1 Tax=Fibrella forsythiae TaxID=2817061 RepID=A0ABS3JPY1_9BACT|nr:DUF3291 domain-containing protein [Fibrella forsythiae]MBO0952065.1 DUF3291 domain-containing protein [Fibrella forsythiae]
MSLVTVTVLNFAPGQRYRAFANMGRWLMKPFDVPGLGFQKMMGTGKNFGLWPDFSRYVFLGVWATEAQATAFFASEQWQSFLPTAGYTATSPTSTLYLQPIKSHGLWDGVDPFPVTTNVPGSNVPTDAATADRPIAVLTRASIRTGALLDFWRNVPEARKRIDEQGDNLLMALGAGEKPLVQQCTISVWQNAALVDQFAYRQSGHREIVKKTRQRKWYSEELFARFTVLRMDGFNENAN